MYYLSDPSYQRHVIVHQLEDQRRIAGASRLSRELRRHRPRVRPRPRR